LSFRRHFGCKCGRESGPINELLGGRFGGVLA